MSFAGSGMLDPCGLLDSTCELSGVIWFAELSIGRLFVWEGCEADMVGKTKGNKRIGGL